MFLYFKNSMGLNVCLKTENRCLKIILEIRVDKKCCLKTKNDCLKTQTKYPYVFHMFWYSKLGVIFSQHLKYLK